MWAARFVAAGVGKNLEERLALVDTLRSEFSDEDYSAAILLQLDRSAVAVPAEMRGVGLRQDAVSR